MESSRISSKGQLVVPKGLRDSLNIKPGTRVKFEPKGGGFMVHVPGRFTHEDEVDRLAGCLARYGRGKSGSARSDDEAILQVVGAEDERTKTPRKRRR